MFLYNTCAHWLLILTTLILPSFAPSATAPPIHWVVEKSSILKISGKSNVNAFTCQTPGYHQADTLVCTSEGDATKPVRLTGCLTVDVFSFNCHSKMITGDLRKTLNAKDYPQLTVRFLTMDRLPDFTENTRHLKGWVEVELAGIRKTFQINYEFIKCQPQRFQLNGGRVFCFSDFNLTPPKKLAGTIQIKDEFVVDFRLVLKAF